MDNQESETTLEVVATAAATGSFNDPFDGVDFWMMDGERCPLEAPGDCIC